MIYHTPLPTSHIRTRVGRKLFSPKYRTFDQGLTIIFTYRPPGPSVFLIYLHSVIYLPSDQTVGRPTGPRFEPGMDGWDTDHTT